MFTPNPMEGVSEWIPMTPRGDGSLRKWVEGKDEMTMLIGWLGLSPNGEIGTALEDGKAGDVVPIIPFKFILCGNELPFG